MMTETSPDYLTKHDWGRVWVLQLSPQAGDHHLRRGVGAESGRGLQ